MVDREKQRKDGRGPANPTQGMGTPSTYVPTRQQRILTARAVDRALPRQAIGANQVQNSMGVRALRANADRKQAVSDRRAAAAQDRAQAYEAARGRPLHIGGAPRAAPFMPDAQQRRLVQQGVSAAIPPTQGGEAHAATDQLPNAPKVDAAAPEVASPQHQPGELNTFTGRDGVTRAVARGAPTEEVVPAAAPRTLTAAPSTAGAIRQSSGDAAQTINANAVNTRGRATSALLNPMGSDAEMVRRLNNSQRSYMNRGSPQARRLAAQPYLEALGVAADADRAGLTGQNEVVARGAADQAAAHESAAQRGLTAGIADLDASYRDRQLAAEQQRPQQLVRGLDGSTSVLRNDGSASTLRGEDGTAIQLAPEAAQGQVTPAIQYQALSQQLRSLQETAAMNPTSELGGQIQQVQAQMAALTGGGKVQHGAPSEPPAEAIAQLRSNPDAAAQFDEIFGPGAAARYLGN